MDLQNIQNQLNTEFAKVQLDYLVDVIMTWIQKEMERG